jgi:hypothetical protein
MQASNAFSRRPILSDRATTIFAAVVAITFSATSAAPTPLYHSYQESLGLSPALVTVIFASYAFGLLASLLTIGSLSDYVGRRPLVLTALLFNAAAMLTFILAASAAPLVVARFLQGIGTGVAMTTLGATILDTDRSNGPILNSITAFIGLAVGAMGAGALVAWAPAPTELVYAILLAVSLVEIVFLAAMPETTAGRPGALASLRPHVSVPPQARSALARLMPVTIASWALGGFYFSLMPSLVRSATGIASPFAGGGVVATLPLTAVVTVLVLRKTAAARILVTGTVALALGVAVSLAGVWLQQIDLMLSGAVVAGVSFGALFSGVLRTVLPLADGGERAGLLSAYLVASYLAFSLPAIAAGVAAPLLGLAVTAYAYGGVIIVLAAISLLAALSGRRVARTATPGCPEGGRA